MDWQYNPHRYPLPFLGIQASQTWDDLHLWERFFNEHPLRRVVELGTGNGGMAVFLTLQCVQRGVEFWTLDNQHWLDWTQGVPALLGMHSRSIVADLFKEGRARIEALLSSDEGHPLCLFCDNGDKRREWREFVPLLRAGDFIAVHDWGVEFTAADAVGAVSPIMAEWCEARGSMTRWFRREGP